jgi:hypothetical protein
MAIESSSRLFLAFVVIGAFIAGCNGGDVSQSSDEALVVSQRAALSSDPDALQQYAQECDQAIGVTVPDFDCDAGTEVPTTNYDSVHGLCDRPNRLNYECDPGSHFTVLARTDSAYVVGHCRKKSLGEGRYGDIAVIQYSRTNGATCFYQALGDLDGHVKAPSKGLSAWTWKSPSGTASDHCAGCHDNGPFIRSPYLTQVTGVNALPGAGDFAFNRNEPYAFVGADFASWKTYKVEIDGNICNSCHRLGTSRIVSDGGTAMDFGIRATATSEASKNPHSPSSPIWMIPGQIKYSEANAAAAQEIKACAMRLNEDPLPSSASCRITLFAEAFQSQPNFSFLSLLLFT